ncbi:MAG: hypothetical protein OXT63_06210 [Gemmatimonadota bacterium]|nr:hypothetical protein [Gemmatimonadota bacterium]
MAPNGDHGYRVSDGELHGHPLSVFMSLPARYRRRAFELFEELDAEAFREIAEEVAREYHEWALRQTGQEDDGCPS